MKVLQKDGSGAEAIGIFRDGGPGWPICRDPAVVMGERGAFLGESQAKCRPGRRDRYRLGALQVIRPPSWNASQGRLDYGRGVVDMDWQNVRGRAPGLEGLSGRIVLKVGDKSVGALKIDSDGATSVVAETSGAAATITVNCEDTLTGLLRGHLSPIVMELVGRTRIAGDVRFALQVLYGLQAGSSWATTHESRGA